MESDFLLTRKQILSYRANGFLILDDVLTNKQCDRREITLRPLRYDL